MRILLTGAAGFIGTHIGDVARERGHEVVSLDMFLDKAHGPGSSTDPTLAAAGCRRTYVRIR